MFSALQRLPLKLSCTLAAIALAAPLLAPSTAQAREFVSIKGDNVNIREKPTTRSDVMWELIQGYPLQVQKRQGKWLKVRDFEETLGWVYAPLTSKQAHRVVTARNANLRAGPGLKESVIGKLQQYEVLLSLGKSGSWAKVQRSDGQKGWVAKRLTWGW